MPILFIDPSKFVDIVLNIILCYNINVGVDISTKRSKILEMEIYENMY